MWNNLKATKSQIENIIKNKNMQEYQNLTAFFYAKTNVRSR